MRRLRLAGSDQWNWDQLFLFIEHRYGGFLLAHGTVGVEEKAYGCLIFSTTKHRKKQASRCDRGVYHMDDTSYIRYILQVYSYELRSTS